MEKINKELQNKKCSKCKEIKTINAFYKCKKGKFGVHNYLLEM